MPRGRGAPAAKRPRVAYVNAVPLPYALLRYTLRFVEADAQLLWSLSLVSKAWAQAVTAPGVVPELSMSLSVDPRRPLAILGGVASLKAHFTSTPVQCLDRVMFQLTQLQELDIKPPSATKLSLTFFDTLPHLTSLRLEGCKAEDFSWGQHLRKLQLHDCDCSDAPKGALGKCTSLTELHMSDCEFRAMSPATFAHLSALRTLDLTNCSDFLEDSTFSHLTGLTRLAMRGTHKSCAVTNAAFAHLRLVVDLDLAQWSQRRVTDDAFRHLTSLTRLVLNLPTWSKITEDVLQHLPNLRCLHRKDCGEPAPRQYPSSLTELRVDSPDLTDACFEGLSQLLSLDLLCNDYITDEAFRDMAALTKLRLDTVGVYEVQGDGFRYMPQLRELEILGDCACDEEYRHLTALTSLDLSNTEVSDQAFTHLTGLLDLALFTCDAVTDAAFSHLRRLQRLKVSMNTPEPITDEAFRHLGDLQFLSLQLVAAEPSRHSRITDAAFSHLPRLCAAFIDDSATAVSPSLRKQLRDVVKALPRCYQEWGEE